MFGAAIGFFAFWVFMFFHRIRNHQLHIEDVETKDWVVSLVFAIIIGILSHWGLYLAVQSAIKSVVK